MRVFVSYAHSDSGAMSKYKDEIVKQLASFLSVETPRDFFLDSASELTVGEDIRQALREKIDECGYFIVVWSKRAAESDWVQYEVAMADALKKRIVVVKEKDAPELPFLLQGCKVIEGKETG